MTKPLTQTERKRRVNSIGAAATTGGVEYALPSVDMDAAISAFLRYCNVRNLTVDTVKYYSDSLGELKRLMAAQSVIRPIDIEQEHLYTCIERKQEQGNVSDTTINTYLRAWRAFFNYLTDEAFLTINPFSGLKLLKTEKKIIETFSKEQIRKLLDTPNKQTFTGYRNYLLMSVLLDTGVRISEAEGIKITGIQWRERLIKVYGKGRKERLVPFQSTLERHLREFITIRGPLDHDFLFVNIDNEPWRMRSMQEVIADIGLEAGIKGVRCSPHTFRHTFARLYITNGGDIFSLQKILGHTTLDMVRNYVNLWGTDVSRQHAKFSPLDRLDED
ncbi:tyrosine-type recombinase/integrase [Paenibacillus hamazuiensis]|uniref:tyrosine-type recombinase/integrase n=1 Tax=Paenibacillus hamazuiensis TaxID=2936508 RepID=UPI0020107920|nr:tyrosine-type recombinase/integrase [Paenibacillus hamazuiensis]